LVEGYGLSEASPLTHANPLAGVRKVGSIGVPVPCTDARIARRIEIVAEIPKTVGIPKALRRVIREREQARGEEADDEG